MKLEEITALERRTHPKSWWGGHFEPVGYSDQDLADQVEKGLRPRKEAVVGAFFATGAFGPGEEPDHWRREVQTWTLPTLVGVHGHSYSLKKALQHLG